MDAAEDRERNLRRSAARCQPHFIPLRKWEAVGIFLAESERSRATIPAFRRVRHRIARKPRGAKLMLRVIFRIGLAACAMLSASGALAQAYPSQAIKVDSENDAKHEL